MTNAYGEIVKPRYEVVIQEHVKGSVADDFESIDFMAADNYREAVKRAKAESIKYANDPEHQVLITCYFEDDTSSYNEVWYEFYENGKKVGRYE